MNTFDLRKFWGKMRRKIKKKLEGKKKKTLKIDLELITIFISYFNLI